jgi:hypothetical protein
MENEKDLLNKDLAGLEKKEDIEQFIEDAELLGGHEEIVALAQEKIAALEAQSEAIPIGESEKSQVEYLGGNTVELEGKLEPLNNEIETVKLDATEQIKAMKDGQETVASNEEEVPALEKNFDTIAQPKNLEDIDDYISELKERVLDAIPSEYSESVDLFKKFLQEHPEAQKIAWDYLSSQKYNPDSDNERITELLDSMKTVQRNDGTYSVKEIFKGMSEHYTELQPIYEKMNNLMMEEIKILGTGRELVRIKKLVASPEEINTFFSFPKGYDGIYLDFENRINTGEKLVELGVMSQEDFDNKITNLVSEIEQHDSYINEPNSRFREKRIEEMKKRFNR